MTREIPPLALVGLIRRNRRRYGGYIVHAGVAVLLIGVAASSSFQHSKEVALRPGQSAIVDGYTISYVRPTASATPQKLSFGAVLNVSQGGRHVTTLHTSRGFYPSQDPSLGPVGRFFNGEADSDVGLQWSPARDIWVVTNPDLSSLNRLINRGNRLFSAALTDVMRRTGQLPPPQSPIWQLRNAAITEITNRFVTHPWTVNFLMIVDPLVIWIWIGAIIMVAGGLLALWPVPVLARRRRTAALPVAPAPAAPVTPATPARELV